MESMDSMEYYYVSPLGKRYANSTLYHKRINNLSKMKKINLYIWLVFIVFILGACAEDYLDTRPTADTATSTVFETTENAALAINGLNKMMTTQYLESQGFNGEGTIKMYFGNYPGNHFYVNLSGWSNVINGNYHDNTSSTYDYYPWYYYYKLIGNANSIIEYIDDAEGAEADRQFIKAQALTHRAYSFLMLAQLYSKRWMDSQNGATDGIVLRTDLSTGDIPLSTLAETYERIYDDLDEAISLYTASGNTREFNYDPDINVAYAIYARAAITRQDYGTAGTMAAKAREGYPLMSNSDYRAGFYTPTSEWIWSSYGAPDETLYYYSYFAYIAYNSNASNVRNYPKCISKELYDKIPETDIRKEMFLNPEDYSYSSTTGQAGSALKAVAFEKYPDLYSTAKPFAYMQFKIKAEDLPGVGNLNHFRSSEMYLIEAEAAYFSENENGARNALNALIRDSERDPSYECTAVGDNLLEEIKFYRAVELWGEGFDWFDLKRWGDSIDRKSYDDGGNFLSVLAVSYGPADRNEWTWKIPLKETEYNDAINNGSISEE